MGKKVSFTVKVDEEIHQKLKLAALVQSKSMSALLTGWVQNMEVNIPASLVTGKKSVKPELPTNQESKDIENRLKELFTENLSDFKIAKKMNEEGFKTMKGGIEWRQASVASIRKRLSSDVGGTVRISDIA